MNPPSTLTDHSTDPLLRQAQRPVGARGAWAMHALVFVGVHLLVALRHPEAPLWFSTGWSIGLALHGASVLLRGPRRAWREHCVHNELRRLRGQA